MGMSVCAPLNSSGRHNIVGVRSASPLIDRYELVAYTVCVCDVDVRCSDSLWQTAHIAYDTKKNKLFPISTYVCRRRFIRLFIRGVYGVLYGDGYIAVMFMKYSYLLTIEIRI